MTKPTTAEALKIARDALDFIVQEELKSSMIKPMYVLERAQEALAATADVQESAQQPAIECTRSHPHELMDDYCKLRTEIAKLTNENAHLKAAQQPVSEQEPVGYITHESIWRLRNGGNSKGSVPIHLKESHTAKTPLYTSPQPTSKDMIPLSIDGKSVWLDGIGEVKLCGNGCAAVEPVVPEPDITKCPNCGGVADAIRNREVKV